MTLKKINYFGLNAMMSSLAISLIGYPSQIRLNSQIGNADNLSLLFFGIIVYMSVSWLIYGINKKDWYMISCNVIGAILSSVILFQIIWYRFF